MAIVKFPEDYVPYETMVVCGNTLKHGKAPILVDGRPLFLIGKGPEDPVWLQVPTGKQWRYEIEKNRRSDSAYKVERSDNLIYIYFGHHLLVSAKKESESELKVDHINFTHFGLSIYGDPSCLYIGSQEIRGNMFEGSQAIANVR